MFAPAARVGDMHTCPMVDVLKPHVGGPVMPPGKPTTLIAGMPAATLTCQCLCVSPAPDIIVIGSATVMICGMAAARVGDMTAHGGIITVGCPTVFIGDSGGSGGGSGGGDRGATAAQVSAMQSAASDGAPFCEVCEAEGDPSKESSVEIELLDEEDIPVPLMPYRIEAPGGRIIEGRLDANGYARVEGIEAGECKICFPGLDEEAWEKI